MNFQIWLESFKDVFGFEKEKTLPKPFDNQDPIKRFDINLMVDYLRTAKLGFLEGFSEFDSNIQWGKDVGAIKVEVTPDLDAKITRLSKDLQGNNVWLTKKVYQIDRSGFGGYESVVAQDILNEVNLIFKQKIDSPLTEFKSLETLAKRIAVGMRGEARPIFIFDQVRKLDDNNYLISFECTGQGQGAPDHYKIEKNLTNISFKPDLGVLRIWNTCVQSPSGKRTWNLMPPEMDLYFFPSQKFEEIIRPVVDHLKYF